MSVLISKDKKDLLIDCYCGCSSGIHFRIDTEDPDMYMIMSYVNSNWYKDQTTGWGRFKDKIKKICCILRNKEYRYAEQVITKEGFEQFREYINQF